MWPGNIDILNYNYALDGAFHASFEAFHHIHSDFGLIVSFPAILNVVLSVVLFRCRNSSNCVYIGE